MSLPPLAGRTRRRRTPTVWLVLLLAGACGGERGEAGAAPAADSSAEAAAADPAHAPDPGEEPGAFPVRIEDDAGRRFRFEDAPDRIVSLVPSATEILREVRGRRLLVGRTEYDTAASLAHLPSVGGGLRPSMETLVSLRPDLVITFAGSDPGTAEALERQGIVCFAVRPETIEDVLSLIPRLARIVGRPALGDSLAARQRRGLDFVRADVEGRERPRVAYVLGGTPPVVAGGGSYVHELLEIAGGENAFGDLPPAWPSIGLESFLSREIDLVLVPPGAALPERLRRSYPVREVPAALQRPGPDVATMAHHLVEILHPGALP